MRIELNGEPLELPAPMHVEALLVHLGLGERRVAVEVNREIVPRSRHAQHLLHEGDRVELVHALGGG
jgi:sulfur carrier protein